jgi:TRAP-type C4-dicarboxylate transport system permease small subunit
MPGFVPGIHGFHVNSKQDVDGRSKSGHDRLRGAGVMSKKKVLKEEKRLIEAEDAEVVIEHHPEDWLAFVIFWSLAFIVFLQFFTRYVLNDSLSWTEEIARYGLMWVVFIGGAMVTRRNTHIAVELLSNVMKPGPLRAALLALVDFIKLAFLGLLAFVSWTITERMHFQRMTVFDLPMSYVYAGVAFGCFLMLIRQAINVWRNARNGWSRPDDVTHQVSAD